MADFGGCTSIATKKSFDNAFLEFTTEDRFEKLLVAVCADGASGVSSANLIWVPQKKFFVKVCDDQQIRSASFNTKCQNFACSA